MQVVVCKLNITSATDIMFVLWCGTFPRPGLQTCYPPVKGHISPSASCFSFFNKPVAGFQSSCTIKLLHFPGSFSCGVPSRVTLERRAANKRRPKRARHLYRRVTAEDGSVARLTSRRTGCHVSCWRLHTRPHVRDDARCSMEICARKLAYSSGASRAFIFHRHAFVWTSP